MRTRLGSMAIFCIMTSILILEWMTGAIGSNARLLGLGALPDNGQLHHEYWRLITFGFLHSNLTHLLLNSVLLLIAAPLIERRAGSAWLLLTFICASIASGAGIILKHQIWPSQGVSVGASGGMFGLLGAALVLVNGLSSEKRPIRMGLVIVLLAGLTYSLLPGISMIGHVIGLFFGAGIALSIPTESLNSVRRP